MELPTGLSVRQLLRDVCITTGIEAKPVVLLVDQASEHLQVVMELMSEGTPYHHHYTTSPTAYRNTTWTVHPIRALSDEQQEAGQC